MNDKNIIEEAIRRKRLNRESVTHVQSMCLLSKQLISAEQGEDYIAESWSIFFPKLLCNNQT